MSRTILLFCILIWGAKMSFQYFLVLFLAPLSSFPELVHTFFGLTGIIVTNYLSEFIELFNSFDVSQQL